MSKQNSNIKIQTINTKVFNVDNFKNASDSKLKQFTDKTNRIARAKYVPVATGKTMTSCKATKISNNQYALSTINYGSKANNANSGRYIKTTPNGKYWAYTGRGHKILVPAGKNAGKYEWFNRASDELKQRFDWSIK